MQNSLHRILNNLHKMLKCLHEMNMLEVYEHTSGFVSKQCHDLGVKLHKVMVTNKTVRNIYSRS